MESAAGYEGRRPFRINASVTSRLIAVVLVELARDFVGELIYNQTDTTERRRYESCQSHPRFFDGGLTMDTTAVLGIAGTTLAELLRHHESCGQHARFYHPH